MSKKSKMKEREEASNIKVAQSEVHKVGNVCYT